MAKRTKSYGLNNPLQDVFPLPIIAQRDPKSSDINYELGQQWINKVNNQIYGLAKVTSGNAIWTLLGPGDSDVDTLTGDSGGALSPAAGNINILGGDGLTVDGAGSTLTINRDAIGGYPTTPFVVGPLGEAGYQTIQAGIDAASISGGGLVYIQNGTFTEDLNLVNGVELMGDSEESTIIVGTHLPPSSGTLFMSRLNLQDATEIFNSGLAGTTDIVLENCTCNVTNGYTFNLANWTGSVSVFDIKNEGTDDGFVTNTGSMSFSAFSSGIGNGTNNLMVLSGTCEFSAAVEIGCPITLGTGAALTSIGSLYDHTVTVNSNGTINSTNDTFNTGNTSSIIYNSSGDSFISTAVLNSSFDPVLDGTAAGNLTLTGVSFLDNRNIINTLAPSILGGDTKAGSFRTTGTGLVDTLALTDNIITSEGSSAANINLIISPKGSGLLEISGNLLLTDSATQLRMKGGGITDFIGQVTLVAGVATVLNSNINATDRIFLTRASVGASTSIGSLSVILITAGVSFAINSLDSVAAPVATDVSVVSYLIVRQI